MDTRTGEITNYQNLLNKFLEECKGNEQQAQELASKYLQEVDITKLSQELQSRLKKKGVVGLSTRSRCPCGSGKRFKRCCMRIANE